MQTVAALAIVLFLLGTLIGFRYYQAWKRRLTLKEQDRKDSAKKKRRPLPLDKSGLLS